MVPTTPVHNLEFTLQFTDVGGPATPADSRLTCDVLVLTVGPSVFLRLWSRELVMSEMAARNKTPLKQKTQSIILLLAILYYTGSLQGHDRWGINITKRIY